jgi:hypothetical protein
MQMSGEYCFNTSIRLDNRIRKAKPIEDNRESKIRDTEKNLILLEEPVNTGSFCYSRNKKTAAEGD